ncbi:hypothetical protein Curi_c14210 [Gottschalkia acidurici 9a]|uniref:Uncharacterized protein n=2 Tax=Clostridium acidurici TaxID=1556 RepID=K0B1B5_GOTA9|nr:hypothetical protein Curi_c14210 [Gottschalkia acidurici 9a]
MTKMIMKIIRDVINTHKPLGLFWAKDTKANLYIAVNNNIGKAYKQKFKSLEECINWLMKEEV